MESLQAALDGFLGNQLGLSPETQRGLLLSLAGLAVILVLRLLAMAVVNRRIQDPRTLYGWRKSITYFTSFLAVLVVGRPWLPALRDFSTFLGIVTAGLAVALKDPIVNLAGWVFLLWRRPFEVGDRIQVGEHAGDVIDIRIFQFTLMEIGNWVDADQSTGRIIHLPNGALFQVATANFSKGFRYIWNELPVLVTFESNWKKAKATLLDIITRHAIDVATTAETHLRTAARKYMIFYSKLTPTVYTSVHDSGVLLTIRYLCEPRRRRGTAEVIWEEILQAFAGFDDVDFAYPTQRFYANALEGKSGARAGSTSPPTPPENPGDPSTRCNS